MGKVFFVLFFLFSTNVLAQDANTFNILFKSNKSNLPDSARFQLIKKVFTINPAQITIIGHCDSIGSNPFNIALSKRRAAAVKKILVDNGFTEKEITTCIGYGENKPLVANSSEADRQKNRRVEVQFVGVKKMPEPKVDIIQEKIKLPAVTPTKTIAKESLQVGKKIVLENLFFVPGMHRLKEESYGVMQELSNIMMNNPKLIIEIQGHVCCTFGGILDGRDIEYNSDNLSVTRAREIYELLIANGINKNRLKYKGFGGSKKIYELEQTEEEKAANRRVEILILSQ